jgi:Fe-S oxidoreductase
MNARNVIPGIAWLTERLTGFSANRQLPRWRRDVFRLSPSPRFLRGEGRGEGQPQTAAQASAPHPNPLPTEEWGEGTREVALFADTFNTYFEPENLHAAVEVLTRLGYHVVLLRPDDAGGPSAGGRFPSGGSRPLCCGRTFLAAGLVDEARVEARRLLAAAAPFLARGIPIIGLEPSCLLTLRDEFLSLLPGAETERVARHAFLLEEFLVREAAARRIAGPIGRHDGKVLLHGHCHQKAFGVMGSVGAALALVEGLEVETVESSCCGMAGAFGYGAETYAVSIAMGLLRAVRRAAPDAVIAADGFSCRHQIRDGTGRQPRHIARILSEAISGTTTKQIA